MPEQPHRLKVFFATPLEEEYVEQIAALDPRLEIVYRPDLLGRIRFVGDHTGEPLQRTAAQQAEWDACLAEADILWDYDKARPRELPRLAPKLKLLFATSSGVATWLRTSGLVESDVLVVNAAGIHPGPMAEWTIFAMLAFAKDFRRVQTSQRLHHWDYTFVPRELSGATLALVGLGVVGREIARRARQFRMRVLAHRRRLDASDLEDGVVERIFSRDELTAMLAQADYVVLIVASTPETERLIGPAELAAMRSHAVVINLARGAVVDEAALADALAAGRLGGAALDVFDPEPLDPASPLWDLPNTIITAHTISHSPRESERLTALFSETLLAYLNRRPIPNLVDKRLGYSLEPARITGDERPARGSR